MASKLTITIVADDGTVESTIITSQITPDILERLARASAATITPSESTKRKLPASASQRLKEIEFLQGQIDGIGGKKRKINCPFHNDRTPSAEVSAHYGFKCFSSNCKYCNVFMPRSEFVAALRAHVNNK